MKFSVALLILLILVSMPLSSCKSTPKFSDVTGKEWLLVEIQTEGDSTLFSRETLKSEGFGNIFTLNFDAERLSGVGAPNRFTAPYKADKKLGISVQLIAGTLMAPLREPERLKEQDYFTYLQNAYKWNYTKDGTLELHSKNAAGIEAVLIYKL